MSRVTTDVKTNMVKNSWRGVRRHWLGVVGWVGAVMMAVTLWLALWVTPPDEHMGNLVRLLYLHPSVAWVALYLAGGLAALASLLYLWRRTRSLFWDRVAASSVEVAVIFSGLTLVTGSIWGRPTWGVWWTWDARLTSTALLFVLLLGYLALRRVPAESDVRAKRCAVAALIAAADVPIVHFSVEWWNTLHQGPSVITPDLLGPKGVHGSMAYTLALSFVGMSLLFVWMVVARYRIEVLRDQIGQADLEISLAERRAEGLDGVPVTHAAGVSAGDEPVGAATAVSVGAGAGAGVGALQSVGLPAGPPTSSSEVS